VLGAAVNIGKAEREQTEWAQRKAEGQRALHKVSKRKSVPVEGPPAVGIAAHSIVSHLVIVRR